MFNKTSFRFMIGFLGMILLGFIVIWVATEYKDVIVGL